MDHTPTRILLVRTDRLGDVILTLPMIALLRRRFPKAFLAMLLQRYTGEIVEGNPYLNKILWYDDQKDLKPFLTMRAELRAERFDTIVVVHPTFRLACLAAAAGISLRIGSGYRWYSFLFNGKVFEHRKDALHHELEYNLRLLRHLDPGLEENVAEFGITISPQEETRGNELLREHGLPEGKPYVVIHPGSGGSARDWPLDHFGMLADGLLTKKEIAVVVTGGRGEEELVNRVIGLTGGKAVSLAGKLSLKELAGVLKNASLFIGNSSGPLHLAVAMGTPVLGFYPRDTAMSAARWGPYTKKKIVLEPASGGDGMESIPVEDAYQAACNLLTPLGEGNTDK